MIALVLACFVPVMAQEAEVIPPIYEEVFVSFLALVAGIPLVTEFFKRLLNASGLAAQIISWVTGVLLALFGFFLNLGIFAPMEIWQALVTGLAASLAANGVFDTGVVEWFLRLIGILKPLEK
jgi:hypothetical protein